MKEIWLSWKIHNEGGVRSVFSNHFVCCADKDTSLALYQEDDGQMKCTNTQ